LVEYSDQKKIAREWRGEKKKKRNNNNNNNNNNNEV
jgi:hypothetical protein